MEKLNSKIKLLFFVALIFSIMLPAGILQIIFGAINNITPILVLGIIFVVLGFYGTPLWWINYANKKRLKTVLNLILNEHIYSVSELSEQLSKNPKEISAIINQLIVGGYLTGYLFKNNETLIYNTNQPQTKKNSLKSKCPNCGAMMESNGVNFVCEFCGFVKEKSE